MQGLCIGAQIGAARVALQGTREQCATRLLTHQHTHIEHRNRDALGATLQKSRLGRTGRRRLQNIQRLADLPGELH